MKSFVQVCRATCYNVALKDYGIMDAEEKKLLLKIGSISGRFIADLDKLLRN